MAIKLIAYEYVPQCDRESPAEEQTSFTIQPHSFAEVMTIKADMKKETPLVDFTKKMFAAIIGWKNVYNKKGESVPFSKGADAINYVNNEVVDDLIGEISRSSGLGAQDKKNSERPPASS